MAQFQEQELFKGAAQRQGFAPVQEGDITPYLRENMATVDANFARLAEAKQKEFDNKLRRQQQTLKTLGEFSSTALEFAKTQAKAYIDNKYVEGYNKMRSYGPQGNYGVTLEEETAYNQTKQSLKAESQQFGVSISQMAKAKSPGEALNYMRSLGQHERAGAIAYYLQEAGNNYGLFKQERYRTDTRQFTDFRDGSKFTLQEINNDPYRQSVANAQLGRDYLTHIGIGKDFQPSHVLMKKFYEGMDKVDTNEMTVVRKVYNVNKSQERDRLVEANFLEEFDLGQLIIGKYGSLKKDGSPKNNNEILTESFEYIADLYAAGLITREQVDTMLDQPVPDSFPGGKGKTFRQHFATRVAGEDGLMSKFATVDRRNRLAKDEEFNARVDAYKDQWLAAQAEQRESGVPFNAATVKSMREQAAVELGIPPESPLLNFFEHYTTKEGRDNQLDIDRLTALRRRRGYLIESDLSDVSDAVYKSMMQLVDEDADIAKRPRSYVSDNEKKITALTNDYFKITDGEAPKTNEWEDMARRARAAEAQYYAEYIRAGYSPEEAQDKTRKRLEENFKEGTYTYDPKITPSVKYRRSLESARLTMANNPQIDSYVFAGSEEALAQLDKFHSGQTDQLPKLYHDLKLGNKNLSAYDIAAAQWMAKTGQVLRANPQQEAVMQHSAGYRRFMNYRPTVKKQLRANATSFKPGQTQQSGSPSRLYKTNVIGTQSGYRGNSNVVSTGYTDYKGREVKFIPEAASDFKRMIAAMEAEGIQFNPNFLTNVYRDEAEYMRLKKEGYKPASNGPHNHGLGFDCSSTGKDRIFNDWVRRRGGEFGFYPHDYHGTHGGHFEYTGVYR